MREMFWGDTVVGFFLTLQFKHYIDITSSIKFRLGWQLVVVIFDCVSLPFLRCRCDVDSHALAVSVPCVVVSAV